MSVEALQSPPKAGSATPIVADAVGIFDGVQWTWPNRLRYQLSLGFLTAVLVPAFGSSLLNHSSVADPVNVNTLIGSSLAFLLALTAFRRLLTFPGVNSTIHILPSVMLSYGAVAVCFFLARFDYARLTLTASFALATLFLVLVGNYVQNRRFSRFYLVPSTTTRALPPMPRVEWVPLAEPKLPTDPGSGIIADLRADLDQDWERMIAQAALAGHPVYHVKRLLESMTGRVEIEHLSENDFGSVIPNLSYRSIKRAVDLITAPLALMMLLLPGLLVALLIKLDSPGPIFFRQQRRGYRGKVFRVIKFRTMTHARSIEAGGKEAAVTKKGDQRITTVGRFLRRMRIDELPQVLNIIRGEMSWIGPRPEALALADWYEAELPFYSYRHIVRPGITGWAQVRQGHVADLQEVQEKLCYDFFYIKHFSGALDALIVLKTVLTVLTGFGHK